MDRAVTVGQLRMTETDRMNLLHLLRRYRLDRRVAGRRRITSRATIK